MRLPCSKAAEVALDQTVLRLLQAAVTWLGAAQCEEPRLDAELLLAAASGRSRAWLPAHGSDSLTEAQAQSFAGFIARRAQHEPVAYILGHKEFYGLDLLVDRRVLIPRPETETLVEEALAWLRRALAPSPDSSEALLTVIDVGTGSGAIALSLAAHTPPAVRIIALDVSPDALAVARANAARHGLTERITFVQSDLLAGTGTICSTEPHSAEGLALPIDLRADLIVANLPYIARAEWATLAPDISAYEPHLALDGGEDGLDLYRRFFAQCPAHLRPAGALLLEIGRQQTEAVRALAQSYFPQAQVRIIQDLAGQDRVAAIETYLVP